VQPPWAGGAGIYAPGEANGGRPAPKRLVLGALGPAVVEAAAHAASAKAGQERFSREGAGSIDEHRVEDSAELPL